MKWFYRVYEHRTLFLVLLLITVVLVSGCAGQEPSGTAAVISGPPPLPE